jgi:hypothetical protein
MAAGFLGGERIVQLNRSVVPSGFLLSGQRHISGKRLLSVRVLHLQELLYAHAVLRLPLLELRRVGRDARERLLDSAAAAKNRRETRICIARLHPLRSGLRRIHTREAFAVEFGRLAGQLHLRLFEVGARLLLRQELALKLNALLRTADTVHLGEQRFHDVAPVGALAKSASVASSRAMFFSRCPVWRFCRRDWSMSARRLSALPYWSSGLSGCFCSVDGRVEWHQISRILRGSIPAASRRYRAGRRRSVATAGCSSCSRSPRRRWRCLARSQPPPCRVPELRYRGSRGSGQCSSRADAYGGCPGAHAGDAGELAVGAVLVAREAPIRLPAFVLP